MTEPAENVVSIGSPSDAAKLMRRRAYEIIEENYDEKHKRYKIGLKGPKTDEGMAKLAGCSVSLIENIREEFFGPASIDEPTEQIKELQKDLSFLHRNLKELEDMSAGIRKQAVDLRAKVVRMEAQLKEMCQAHGWYH